MDSVTSKDGSCTEVGRPALDPWSLALGTSQR